ncbi:hypothetical protein D5687_10230 [Guyparkeria sp. SCN-R1]|uniref:hypothetical protein n=1 Tax=Guyparkeria sp. SCN-R1 TaxID=2341113 RepID=UPI000F6513AD|nr:hypothetical protein [Guyparkeria sp. SCN-R1]RRQ20245.1 hypothetical protein D5687_10230 [Guyparkeria sp. SCN-R1]
MNDAFGKQDITLTGTIQMIATGGQRVRVQRLSHDLKISFLLALSSVALVALTYSGSTLAAGSRAAVEAKPGEIVLLRAVPARPAARSMPPGRALLVDASPKSELEQGLSHLEISPNGYGQVAAGTNTSVAAPSGLGATITSVTQQVGGSAHRGDSAPSVAGGAIGSVTGSIGSTITGALSGAGLMGQGGQR